MIQAVWRRGSDGAWYVACPAADLANEQVSVLDHDYCGRHVITVIKPLPNEPVQYEGETYRYLYDFERDDDHVDG